MSSEISEIPTSEATTVTRAGYGGVLRNRQFVSLWMAQIFSQFADRAVFVLFVAVLTAQELTNPGLAETGAAQLTSWLYVAFTIPAVLLSPLAGVCVDRWSHKLILVLSNIFRGACVWLVVLPIVGHSRWAVFGLAFLSSIGCQFFGPAETASIPRLVKREDLYAANSLFFTTMMIALGFGFAVGDPIISAVGLNRAPIAVACLFFIAALLLLFISDSAPRESSNEPWWEELRFGLAYISSNAVVFRAIMKIMVLFSTIITLNIVAVGLTQQVLHLKPFQFGYIVAAAGLGMGIGNFWVAHWGHSIRPNLLVYSGFCGLGTAMALLGCLGFFQRVIWPYLEWGALTWQGPLIAVPLGISIALGFSCGVVAVPTQAGLQAVVPEELRGKVFGAQNTAMSAASTIPVVLAGALIDNLPGGVSTTLFLIGIPIFVVSCYHLARCTRRVEGS